MKMDLEGMGIPPVSCFESEISPVSGICTLCSYWVLLLGKTGLMNLAGGSVHWVDFGLWDCKPGVLPFLYFCFVLAPECGSYQLSAPDAMPAASSQASMSWYSLRYLWWYVKINSKQKNIMLHLFWSDTLSTTVTPFMHLFIWNNMIVNMLPVLVRVLGRWMDSEAGHVCFQYPHKKKLIEKIKSWNCKDTQR